MGSRYFLDYVANINRMNLLDLIDACHRAQDPQPFKASLVANPVTGLPYGYEYTPAATLAPRM